MSLASDAEVLRSQLGMEPGLPIIAVITEAEGQLGITPEGNLPQRAEVCLQSLGTREALRPVQSAIPQVMGEPVVPMDEPVVPMGEPVNRAESTVPIMPVVASRAAVAPEPRPGPGRPIAGRAGPLRLTLTSHPGRAMRIEGDCSSSARRPCPCVAYPASASGVSTRR